MCLQRLNGNWPGRVAPQAEGNVKAKFMESWKQEVWGRIRGKGEP